MNSFGSLNFVLLVGEGNFSYAANYLKSTKCALFYATCLEPGGNLDSKTKENVNFITKHGGKVLFGVDATQIHSHELLQIHLYHTIIFNFPHVNTKMNLRDNCKLVSDFFHSAKCLLNENGKIYLSLCKGQGGTVGEVHLRLPADSWRVVDIAADQGLVLSDIKYFDGEKFESYECTGFRGQRKPFNIKDAVTHVFSQGVPISITYPEPVDENEIDMITNVACFRAEMNTLYNSSAAKVDKPFTRSYGILARAMDKYKNLHKESVFVPKLILCRNATDGFLSTALYNLVNKLDMCSYCVYSIFSFFKKQKNSVIYSTVMTLCCVECFKLDNPPISHVVAYFSKCRETLQKCMDSIFEDFHISKEPLLRRPVSTWLDFVVDSKEGTIVVEEENDSLDNISKVKTIPIYACYTITKYDCKIYYTDLNIILSEMQRNDFPSDTHFMKIGCVVEFSDSDELFFGAILNLDAITMLKFHIPDYRIMYSDLAFYSDGIIENESFIIFRSPSLYSSSYTHDTSFWIDEILREKYLFLLARNTADVLIKNISLIDVYTDPETCRNSRCYRFTYQSCDKPLSSAAVNELHTSHMRRVLEKNMKITLR